MRTVFLFVRIPGTKNATSSCPETTRPTPQGGRVSLEDGTSAITEVSGLREEPVWLAAAAHSFVSSTSHKQRAQNHLVGKISAVQEV